MKTNCDIIRDLLPLYAEHITSEASNALVEEHLAECEVCRAELEQMEQPVPVRPEAQPDAPLQRIGPSPAKKEHPCAIGSVLAALMRSGNDILDGHCPRPGHHRAGSVLDLQPQREWR